MWVIEGTGELADWFGALELTDKRAIEVAVRMFAASGPALGRPFVDSVSASRHANMKELRPLATNIRILFAFDPRRTAILLLGSDITVRRLRTLCLRGSYRRVHDDQGSAHAGTAGSSRSALSLETGCRRRSCSGS
jgi:hypothetical protein